MKQTSQTIIRVNSCNSWTTLLTFLFAFSIFHFSFSICFADVPAIKEFRTYISNGGSGAVNTGIIGAPGFSSELDMSFNAIPRDASVLASRNGNNRFYLLHYYGSLTIGFSN